MKKLSVIGITIALLTTTLTSAPILLQQQSSGAITGGSLNPATRYCVVGTGAGTGKACIPCDIGLGAGNCRDTLTGWTPCPRYGPIPPNCTLDPFNPLNQVPGTTVTPAPGVLDPTLDAAGGGVAQQQPTPIPTPTPPPPLFGRNVGNAPLGGFFEQSPTTTPPPQFGQIAPEGQVPLTASEAPLQTDIGVAEQPRTCPVGNTWDPDLMICVPDLPPLQLCPDGSIPQPAGSTQPRCPPFEAEQPYTTTTDETPPSPLPPPPAGEVTPEAEIAELQTQDDKAAESEEGEGEEEPPAEQPEQPETEE
jgi:hypothetical protein